MKLIEEDEIWIYQKNRPRNKKDPLRWFKHTKGKKRAKLTSILRYHGEEKIIRHSKKQCWKQYDFFNRKAGGRYTKIKRLVDRREQVQFLYFKRKKDNIYHIPVNVLKEGRRQKFHAY